MVRARSRTSGVGKKKKEEEFFFFGLCPAASSAWHGRRKSAEAAMEAAGQKNPEGIAQRKKKLWKLQTGNWS
jgi:hypothetical protein